MAGEWFRAVKVSAFVGIPRDDPPLGSPTYGMPGLDRILSEAGVFESLVTLLEYHTIREPLHVTLRDLGYNDPRTTPRILVLDTIACQIDGGLNEIPRGTCSLAIGRVAHSPDTGTPSLDRGFPNHIASSIIHVLEKYLTRHVAAKIYATAQWTASAGVGDLGDNAPFTDEPFVLLDGIATGPTRRGDAENSQFVLHITHFLSQLTFSSAVSGQVSPGSAIPTVLQPGVITNFVSGAGLPMTPFAAVIAVFGANRPVYTDFWGYQIPSSDRNLPQLGVKGLLEKLADQDIFNWQAMKNADTGGTFISPKDPSQLKNDRALAALRRIEPIWPDWDAAGGAVGVPIAGAAFAGATWNSLDASLAVVRAQRSRAADRSDMISLAGGSYAGAGYTYGMPIGLYITANNGLNVQEPARAFGADIAYATFENLAPTTFWDLISSVYPSRYQLAIAPMADRAVMMPAAPILDGIWQKIYASEVFSWSDDLQNPIPIRGVILAANRSSGAGSLTAGYKPIEAGFDSCQAGVFVTKEMPAWLMTAYSQPGSIGAATQTGIRNASSAPWLTGPGALAAIGGLAVSILMGAPSAQDKSTANLLAKSLWQQERLRYRSIFLTGRFRTDIGPGSQIQIELPADRNVRAALGDQVESIATGMVLRVTHTIDAEGESCSTALQVGFVRLEGETVPGQPLYADSHPIWRSAVYGIPWCDSVAMRNRLGSRANIVSGVLDLLNGG